MAGADSSTLWHSGWLLKAIPFIRLFCILFLLKIYVMDGFTIEFPIASQRRTQSFLSGVQGGVLDAETQGIDLEEDLDLEC